MSPFILLSLLGLSLLIPVFDDPDTLDDDLESDDDVLGSDEISGTVGNDILTAVLGETLSGEEGDDTLVASEASVGAVLNGGAGADNLTLNGRSGAAFGGEGQDTISMFGPTGPGDDNNITADGGDGDDTITAAAFGGTVIGGGGDDVISVQGTLDRVDGGNGDDTIHGGALDSGGGTPLFGGAGNDVISTSDDAGFDYRSELDGGLGNDTLTTELLAPAPTLLDALTGGAGNDVFEATTPFSPADSSAGGDLGTLVEVTDFNAAEDALIVELSGSGVFLAQVDAQNETTFDIRDLEDGSGSLLEFTITNADASGPVTGSMLLSGVTGIDPASVDFGVRFVDLAEA